MARKSLGFEFYVGGGLGSVRRTRSCHEFLPRRSCCRWRRPVSRVSRASARSRTAAKSRIKSWSRSSASTRSSALVLEERATLGPDALDGFLADIARTDETGAAPRGALPPAAPGRFDRWRAANVVAQRPAGLRHGVGHAAAR